MKPDERQDLKAMLDRLDRAELPGDVGRMVYLALENATDERQEAEVSRARATRRERSFGSRLRRWLGAFSPKRRRR